MYALCAHTRAALNRSGPYTTGAGGVLFLTSLSSPGGLYGCIRYVGVSRTHGRRSRRRRRRRSRGFSRQYANAFRRSGGMNKKEDKKSPAREKEKKSETRE